ncbi:MAG TPA: choice-of-anchor tandem repeat GloVer-containing protein [Candidatus Cybelea sp.]
MRTYRIVLILSVVVGAGCARLASGSSVPAVMGGGTFRAQHEATTYKSLYVFDVKHGAHPTAALTVLNGVLYGTTGSGGKHGKGTVFNLTTAGKETVLYNFTKHEYAPDASVLPLGGLLYGTTAWSGVDPGGGIYALEPNGKLLWRQNFKGRYNGYHAEGGLTDLHGALYGTTSEGGGSQDGGAFYRVTTRGKERELYAFKGWPDGNAPQGNLLLLDGVFYGTTAAGGEYSGRSAGTVFRMTSSGRERVLYTFLGYSPGGDTPVAGLVEMGGLLYGTTEAGGADYEGVVFSMTTSGKEKVLYNFGAGSGDGQRPRAPLIAYKGKLYGTTFVGGAYGMGTVFEVTTSGTESVLHSFSGGTDGAYPLAGLVALHGLLYGTTVGGYTSSGDGTVFAISP